MTRLSDRLLLALDLPSAEEALLIAQKLRHHVAGFKVGLELITGPGPGVIGAVRELGLPVFADAKLHDIPNTVGRAAQRLGGWGARWVSVHASGGEEMMRAAVEGLGEGAAGNPAGVLGITVLTSLRSETLASIGVSGSLARQVTRLAKLAARSGVEGVVCAPRELGDVGQTAPQLLRVTPGIRRQDETTDDQSRVASAAEALKWGADYLVVGRPITKSPDPVAAIAALEEDLA